MSTRQGRRGGRRETAVLPISTGRARKQTELEDLLREAEEALRDCELPSGDWNAGGPPPRPFKGAIAERPAPSPLPPGASPLGADLTGLEDIDSEVAFWLLFPPRGNA